MRWNKPCWLALAVLMLASRAGHTQTGEETYPILGLTLREKIGGLLSIPGQSLPPLSTKSMRTIIALQEGLLQGMRLWGEQPPLARGLGYVATLYASIGDMAMAERRFAEAQRILEKNKASGLDLGWVHNNRGLALLDHGRYAEAVGSFRAAVTVLSPVLPESQSTALRNLATAHERLGEFGESEGAYLQALDILRQLRKESDRIFQVTRGNLALLYSSIGDFVEARKILEDLLQQKELDPAVHFTALNNLGYLLAASNDGGRAEILLKEAVALTGERSRERALAITNLAAAYGAAGDFARARQEGEKALRLAEELYGPGSPSAATVEATLGFVALAREDLAQADRLLTRARTALSRESRDRQALAEVIQNLAFVAQRRDQRARAIDLSREALDLQRKNLDRILAFGSEAQRLAYQSHASPFDQLATLGDGALLAEAVLTMKGAVLESLLAERALARRSQSPEDRERLESIHSLKVELMEKTARGETHLEAIERALKQEETALARSLARSVTPRLPADLARVQAALADDQVLIEIIRFRLYEGGGKRVPWYGGVVISRRGSPAWVPLGRAEALEELDIGMRGVERLSMAWDVARTLRELDDRFWKPFVKVFPAGTRKVLLSPDSALAFVPWPALLDENEKFLAERWQLAFAGSGRDVLRVASKSSARTLLALADGKEDLLFSRQEVERLARTAELKGWHSTILLGAKASEAALFRQPGPRILHLATHGGVLTGEMAQEIGSRLSQRPMYRGFLQLGGAERTLDSWRHGVVPPFSNDGILTAEEVGGLDLSGTWLTVLSACQTGAGDAQTGEGVLGLRRGFTLAGTEHLLFTLWSVDDEATARFMESFYERLFQTEEPVRAFQETQRAELLRWRQKRGIPEAVFRAGGFVLTR